MGITILVIVIISFLVYYFWKHNRWGVGKKYALRQDARRLFNIEHDAADEIIDRQIEVLKKNHPGHTEEWYLEKVIYDLERDR